MTDSAKTGSSETNGKRRLYRSSTDRVFSGVCGGLASYLNIDAIIVRAIWAAAVLFGGAGLMAYILAWFIIPENRQNTIEQPMEKRGNSSIVWGVVLVAVGTFFLIRQFDWFHFHPFYYMNWYPRFWNLRFDLALPLLLIIVGGVYVYNVLKKDASSAKTDLPQSGEKAMNDSKKLTRSAGDRMISGVCGGLASYFNVDPSLVRIGFALLTLASGGFAGIVVYIIMMVVVPEETADSSSSGAEQTAPAPKPAIKTSSKPAAKATPTKRKAVPKAKPGAKKTTPKKAE